MMMMMMMMGYEFSLLHARGMFMACTGTTCVDMEESYSFKAWDRRSLGRGSAYSGR